MDLQTVEEKRKLIVEAYQVAGLLKMGAMPTKEWFDMGEIVIRDILTPSNVAERLKEVCGMKRHDRYTGEVTVTTHEYDDHGRNFRTTVEVTPK